MAVPRDREGTFEPQLLGKYQRRLPGFDEKILALYAKGLTTRDIQDIIHELYGVEISPTAVARDLRKIYTSATVQEAEQEFKKCAETWDSKYPTIYKQWTACIMINTGPYIISMFDLPPAIRKATYTTNTIESVSSAIRT